MCEFLAVFFIGRHMVGQMAEDKGYSNGLFTFLFVLGWFGAEFGAFFYNLGMFWPGPLPDIPGIYAAYFKAIGAAFVASILMVAVVLLLPTRRPKPKREHKIEDDEDDDYRPRPRPKRRRPRDDDDFDRFSSIR